MKAHIIAAVISGIILFVVIFCSIKIYENVSNPIYKELVEFDKLIETLKDKEFIITIDGKEHKFMVKDVQE
jgi:hypothetical protein